MEKPLAEVGGNSSRRIAITLLSPHNHAQEVQVTNNLLLAFLEEEYTVDSCDKYFDRLSDKFAPADISFAWEGTDSRYTLLLAENNTFSHAKQYTVTTNMLFLNGLKGNTTYYWKVWGNGTTSDVYTFTTAATPRTVSIEGVTNSRDMGGWKTADGGWIKQGVLFRTALLDGITPRGIAYCLKELQIKTELDLRRPDEGSAGTCFLGKTVQYINISSPHYGVNDGNIFLKSNHAPLREILHIFAEEANYPILFHCAGGRDRTGTIAFLLQALCGMREEDICREYDLSFFSANGETTPSEMHNRFFLSLITGMKAYSTGTWQQNVVQYCLDIGITESELKAIRKNLIEFC
ncbi:MAG: tyrosine-protein phosphatase [Clostridia bacterium]|nr:tyrosine-protein phosphatase [Clostridia bacterium]